MVSVTGDANCLVGPHSRMSLPLADPSTGARKTSPAGRLPKAPLFVRIPVSANAFLPFVEKESEELFGVLILIESAVLTTFANARVVFARAFQSTFIAPSSMETSKRGILAYLQPQILVSKSLNRVWLVE